jgi:hypothetical protein
VGKNSAKNKNYEEFRKFTSQKSGVKNRNTLLTSYMAAFGLVAALLQLLWKNALLVSGSESMLFDHATRSERQRQRSYRAF